MNGHLSRQCLTVAVLGLLASLDHFTSALVAQTTEQPGLSPPFGSENSAPAPSQRENSPFVRPGRSAATDEFPGSEFQQTTRARIVHLSANDYAGGWRQAGDGDDGLDSQVRRHVLFLTPDGQARGRISLINPVTHDLIPASNLTLTFLTPEGGEAFQARVEPNGTFQLKGVPRGVYGVVAQGPTAFMTFAVQTIREDGLSPTTDWSFDGAAVPERDFPALLAILSIYDDVALETKTLNEPADDQIPAEAIPQGNWRRDDGFNMEAIATPLKHHQAYLQDDGRLLGRLRVLHPVTGRPIVGDNLNVYIIQNGEILASTPTNHLGRFGFENVSPGVYSLVAEGEDGFLAFGIDVVNQPPAVADQADPNEVNFFDDQPGLEIDAAAIPLSSLTWIRNNFGQAGDQAPASPLTAAPPMSPISPLGPGVPPGSAAGGFAGGGSGVTGGGGFGAAGSEGLIEALAIAGLAAAGFALAQDDDNDNPVSPATP